MSGPIGSSFAIYPFGAGSPSTTTAPPAVPALTALFLDPRTRDHVVMSDSELGRMPVVRQMFAIALMTVVGSMTSNPTFGVDLPKKIDDSFDRRARTAVLNACRHITGPKLATITNITVDTATTMGRANITVSYTDLTTGSADIFSTRGSIAGDISGSIVDWVQIDQASDLIEVDLSDGTVQVGV